MTKRPAYWILLLIGTLGTFSILGINSWIGLGISFFLTDKVIELLVQDRIEETAEFLEDKI